MNDRCEKAIEISLNERIVGEISTELGYTMDPLFATTTTTTNNNNGDFKRYCTTGVTFATGLYAWYKLIIPPLTTSLTTTDSKTVVLKASTCDPSINVNDGRYVPNVNVFELITTTTSDIRRRILTWIHVVI